jgi:hypothetical protein
MKTLLKSTLVVLAAVSVCYAQAVINTEALPLGILPRNVEAVGQNRCGLTGDLFRLRCRCKERIIHKVVSYLCTEPAVDT